VGQLIYDSGNKQWDVPKLRELLETILPQKTAFDNYEVEHNFTTIGRRVMLLNARQIQRLAGKGRNILLAIEDITVRRAAARTINMSEKRYRRLFEAAKDGVLILETESGKIIDVNPFLIELTGYSKDDFIGKSIWEIGASKVSFAELLTKGYIRYEDLPLRIKDGRRGDVEFVSNVYRVGDGYAGLAALERRMVMIPDLRAEPNTVLLTEHLAGDNFVC